ncbi:glycogen synthase [Longispora albida]|uniref:glycogen synthase n=1 Tax=Longispora albida TaxID=203523 RepID=UPI0003757284|nr:glycogen synthase [Longispora albida]
MAVRAGLISREYPPEIYGGLGTYLAHLVPQLRSYAEVEVHCFGAPRPAARSYPEPRELASANPALRALATDVLIAAELGGLDLVHSHGWYVNLAGHLAKLLHGLPHVITAHTLETHRPWKRDQLGGGYEVSSWIERVAYEAADAVIAVSAAMRADVLAAYPGVDPARVHIARPGVDTSLFYPDHDPAELLHWGIDPGRPIVLYIGRNTPQKGLGSLLAAAHLLDSSAQLVVCSWAPDTPELGAWIGPAVGRAGGLLIGQPIPQQLVRQLLSQAAVVVCPSVYEPLGMVNLEAMACGTPVVAARVGGIPEVVAHGRTGLLIDQGRSFPARLAEAVNGLLADPAEAERMGQAGRQRAEREFSWAGTAARTLATYRAACIAREPAAGQPGSLWGPPKDAGALS